MLSTALSRGAIVASAALVLAGCRSADRPGAAAAQSDVPGAGAAAGAAAGAGAAPTVVTVTARDFAFDAPKEVPAGLTTFRLVNDGPSLHHIQLIKLSEGKTAADFIAALKAGGPPPKWAAFAGGPNPPDAGGTASATVPLEPGNYVMICFVPAADGMPHVMKGMIRPLTVTAASGPAKVPPAADLTMKLVDYDFQLSAPLTAGKHVIKVENAGPQPHEVAIVRLKPGKTPEDFVHWGEKPVGPAPGDLYGGVSVIMPGADAYAEVDLPAGDYALLCFMGDAKDGKPHFAHGMMKRIEVK